MDQKLLETLAARAEQKEKSRAETKTFTIGETAMEFVKPSQGKMLEYFESMVESSGAAGVLSLATTMIYDCCPSLQEPELHAALGVVDPMDTDGKLLDMMEINALGNKLADWIGLNPAAAEDTVKN